jgi:flavin reductase (DIM6/NTAB) family NADH-FMN oxidoreductase RutF
MLMILNPEHLTHQDCYKILVGSVLPRPIAWVSSMDLAGNLNLAPFSYFTIVSNQPMTLVFCIGPLETGDGKKDTLRNVQAVPEFVINITNQETAEAMNLTATALPSKQSEFEWAGLTPVDSESIRVPRVAEAPIAFECRLRQVVIVSEAPGGGSAVFGDVQRLYVRDDLYDGGRIDLERLQPIGRLAGTGYVRVTDLFDMARVPPPGAS